ncbi:MAG: hypothetical protein ISQ34_04210 [Rickettsiales bacterium]|nr:hypothetical protein [Rickettsiales bacterium]
MPLISNIYLILLLPLLASSFCAIIKNTSINYITTLSILGIIVIQLLNLFPNFFNQNYINTTLTTQPSSLILNYNFNIVGLVFAIFIFFQKIISLIFFKEQIEPKIKKTYSSFYISTLINIFAILLILTSSNFVNLFLAIEIYTISLTTSHLALSTKEQNKLSFKQILVNNTSSAIFILSSLFVYLNFHSFEFEVIKNSEIKGSNITIILLLLVTSIALKFFQIWEHFKNIKISAPIQQYISFQNLFTKSIIGIYLILKLANIFYFGNIDKYLIIFISVFTAYFSLSSLPRKNLKILLIYYCLHHINLMLLAILINNPDSIQSILYYLGSLTLSVFSIYLIAIIIDNYIFSGIVNLRSQKQKGAIIISNIITIVLFLFSILPISFLFFANFYLIKASFSNELFFIIIPTILLTSTSFFISTLSVRSELLRKILKEKIIKKVLKKSHINLSFFNYNFYLIIIVSLVTLNAVLLFNNYSINKIFFDISKFIITKQI